MAQPAPNATSLIPNYRLNNNPCNPSENHIYDFEHEHRGQEVSINEPTAKITVFTADEYREAYQDFPRERIRLVKTYSLDESTGKVKKGNPGKIASGTFSTYDITLRKLKKGIEKFTEQHAIGLGTAEQEKGLIGFKHWKGEIRKTKENFLYRKQPTFLFFDVDGINLSANEIIEIISKFVPGLAEAGKLIVPSSSAGLYSAEGILLKDSTSAHIYFIIADGTDAHRFMSVVFDRLWLAGYGFYLLSKAPSLLSRSIIDAAVVGSERLVYEGKPHLLDGITQKRPDSLLIPGDMVDTTLTLDLSPDEKEILEKIRREERERIQPELERAIEDKVDRIAKDRNVNKADAQKIVSDNQKGIIAGSDILYFAHLNEAVTVAQVLADPQSYDRKNLADPLEPDYEDGSKTKAKFYYNSGKPIIHSFAHGGITYTFKPSPSQSVVWSENDIADLLERVKTDCGAPFEPEVIEMLAHMKRNDKPKFMQIRDEIKNTNKAVIITELDKDISSYFKRGKFKSSESSSSSSSGTSSLSPLNDNTRHFQNALIAKDEHGNDELIIESVAAALIADELRGRFAFDSAGVRWLRYTGSQWIPSQQVEFDTAVTELLYAGAGVLGFKNGYETGVAALIQKGGSNRLPLGSENKIPFLNGLLDISDMKLHQITPENATTWVLPFNYTADASCPNFLTWLSVAADNDTETIKLLQAWINALLTGRPDLQIFLHLIGPAGTGKSTFGRITFTLVGDANATTTTLKQLETNRFEAANIYGKRLVAIEEAEKHGGPVSVLKSMTGQDPMRLERKNQQQQGSFIFEGQTLMMSNERLATTDYTSGIERRRITVEFTHRITPEERADFDMRGGETVLLHSEAPGIINWALELSHDEVTSIFKSMPVRVRRANLGAARFNNPIVDWMLLKLFPDPRAKTQVGVKEEYRGNYGEILYRHDDEWLYPNYLTWCRGSGRESVSLQRFSSSLIDAAGTHGISVMKSRVKDGTKIHGLRIRTEHEKSWLSVIEGEDQVKTGVKDNSLKTKDMKTVQDFSNQPYTEKRVYASGLHEDDTPDSPIRTSFKSSPPSSCSLSNTYPSPEYSSIINLIHNQGDIPQFPEEDSDAELI